MVYWYKEPFKNSFEFLSKTTLFLNRIQHHKKNINSVFLAGMIMYCRDLTEFNELKNWLDHDLQDKKLVCIRPHYYKALCNVKHSQLVRFLTQNNYWKH